MIFLFNTHKNDIIIKRIYAQICEKIINNILGEDIWLQILYFFVKNVDMNLQNGFENVPVAIVGIVF